MGNGDEGGRALKELLATNKVEVVGNFEWRYCTLKLDGARDSWPSNSCRFKAGNDVT